jgi:hypothetical protein
MRYESIALILAETVEASIGSVLASFPGLGSPLLLESFFRTLYSLYDLRFSYKMSQNVLARRQEWDNSSKALSDLTLHFGPDLQTALGYSPRVVVD